MRKTSRFLSLFVSIVVVLTASIVSSAEQVTLNVMGWHDFNSAQWKELVAAFNAEHPDIKLELSPAGRLDQTEKLYLMLAGGSPVDVVWTDAAIIVQYAQADLLEELSPYIAKSSLDLTNYPPGGFHENTYAGGLYAFPSETMTYLFFYNQDLFDRAGVAYPNNDWTVDEFLDIARQINRPEDGIYAYHNVIPEGITLVLPWIWGFGGEWFSEDLRRSELNSDGSLAGQQFLVDLMHVYGFSPTYDALGADPNLSFQNGRIGILHSGTWDIRGTETVPSKWDFRWSTVLQPIGPAGQVPLIQTNGWGIVKASQNKDAAWKFVEWFNGETAQQILAKHGGFPAHIPIARDMAFQHVDPDTRNTIMLSASIARPFPVSPAWEDSIIAWYLPFVDVLRGEKDLGVAMAEVVETTNAIIDKYYQENPW